MANLKTTRRAVQIAITPNRRRVVAEVLQEVPNRDPPAPAGPPRGPAPLGTLPMAETNRFRRHRMAAPLRSSASRLVPKMSARMEIIAFHSILGGSEPGAERHAGPAGTFRKHRVLRARSRAVRSTGRQAVRRGWRALRLRERPPVFACHFVTARSIPVTSGSALFVALQTSIRLGSVSKRSSATAALVPSQAALPRRTRAGAAGSGRATTEPLFDGARWTYAIGLQSCTRGSHLQANWRPCSTCTARPR